MRILIIDDSIVFRSFMRDCLADMPEAEVVGAASNGQQALEKMAELKPDLITLDMEMPKLSGLQVLQRMRLEHPKVKVIVVSCTSETDAERTLQALELGAFDFILKPATDVSDPKSYLKKLLFPEVRAALSLERTLKFNVKPSRITKPNPEKGSEATNNDKVVKIKKKKGAADLIAIGSSTGGPAALHAVLEGLPAQFPVPIIVTQHMPKLFIESLASRMDVATKLNCSVAKDGEKLLENHIYIAPGGIHMKIVSKGLFLCVELEGGPRVNHSIPSVDVTFHSLALLSPRIKTLALVLTGMGNDGAEGAKALADQKNHVMIQDEATSSVWGMPGEIFRLGAASEVLPLDQIAGALISHVVSA